MTRITVSGPLAHVGKWWNPSICPDESGHWAVGFRTTRRFGPMFGRVRRSELLLGDGHGLDFVESFLSAGTGWRPTAEIRYGTRGSEAYIGGVENESAQRRVCRQGRRGYFAASLSVAWRPGDHRRLGCMLGCHHWEHWQHHDDLGERRGGVAEQEHREHRQCRAFKYREHRQSVAGALGAFGRRCGSRYGIKTQPWSWRFDGDQRVLMKMPAAVAEVIKQVAAE